jgi:DNA-binding transcriptional LysR family regulator
MGPLLDEIEAGMAALSEFREKPAGTIRITTGEHAAHTVSLQDVRAPSTLFQCLCCIENSHVSRLVPA